MQVKKKGRKPLNAKAFEKVRAAGKKKTVVSTKEWLLATPPGAHILRKYLKAEYKVQSLENGKGWVIQKI